MKQIIRCSFCQNFVAFYQSYKVHVRDFSVAPLTGERKEVEYEGRICKDCSIKAGYRARSKKKKEE